MYKIVFSAIAAIGIAAASIAALGAIAAAAPNPAMPDGLVIKAAVVCGTNGCAVVQTRRLQRHQLPKTTVHSAL
jgi:hypothetical protein